MNTDVGLQQALVELLKDLSLDALSRPSVLRTKLELQSSALSSKLDSVLASQARQSYAIDLLLLGDALKQINLDDLDLTANEAVTGLAPELAESLVQRKKLTETMDSLKAQLSWSDLEEDVKALIRASNLDIAVQKVLELEKRGNTEQQLDLFEGIKTQLLVALLNHLDEENYESSKARFVAIGELPAYHAKLAEIKLQPKIKAWSERPDLQILLETPALIHLVSPTLKSYLSTLDMPHLYQAYITYSGTTLEKSLKEFSPPISKLLRLEEASILKGVMSLDLLAQSQDRARVLGIPLNDWLSMWDELLSRAVTKPLGSSHAVGQTIADHIQDLDNLRQEWERILAFEKHVKVEESADAALVSQGPHFPRTQTIIRNSVKQQQSVLAQAFLKPHTRSAQGLGEKWLSLITVLETYITTPALLFQIDNLSLPHATSDDPLTVWLTFILNLSIHDFIAQQSGKTKAVQNLKAQREDILYLQSVLEALDHRSDDLNSYLQSLT